MITYQIDRPRRLVVTQLSGGFGLMSLASYLDDLRQDPQFDADFDALIVVADQMSVPRPGTRAKLGTLLNQWSQHRKGTKWAFCLPRTVDRGLAELVLKEFDLQSVKLCCFWTEADARAWLGATSGGKRKRDGRTAVKLVD